MAKATQQDAAYRRMLSLWEPPQGAGDAIGVIATTFTLDTPLFEEECLSRFAGVQSDPVRDGALYCIEREEKLANLICATVVADIHHCAGKRSLRWDLLAARPQHGVMHAKISLLAWKNHIRIIIGSANLTEAGYRRNQECFTALDFNEQSADTELLQEVHEFLREILALTNGPGRDRAESLLAWGEQRFEKNAVSNRGLQRRLILVGPSHPDFFEQLQAILPNSPPSEAHIVSPFFDPELRAKGPEMRLWGTMKARGSVAVHFHAAGTEVPESAKWRLEAPRHLLDATPKGRGDVNALLHPIRVTNVQTENSIEQRPLHAKIFSLSHETWTLLVIGSSNFTSAGMGLNEKANNYEANVAYLIRADSSDKFRREVESRILRGSNAVEISQVAEFARAFDADGEDATEIPALPAFFDQAIFQGLKDGHYLITLGFVEEPPADQWHIECGNRQILNSEQWIAGSRENSITVQIPNDGPPPSVLQVAWSGNTADWPLNISSPESLPAPNELRGLSLAALLELLSSSRPLNEAVSSWLRKMPNDDDAEVEEVMELVDPHAKVDTSGFLIKRVQRACWAISALRQRLEQPVMSASAMAWRISGPVGVYAVLDAIGRQCDSDLPDEWAFLLCEFSRELSVVKLKGVDGHTLDSEIVGMFDSLKNDLRTKLEEARKGGSKSMQAYIADALQQPQTFIQEKECHEVA